MKNIIIGEKYKDKLEKSIIFNGFAPFWLENNPEIDPKLASHADLSVFIHKNTAVVAKYLAENKLVNFLTNRGLKVVVSEREQSPVYPFDVNLCASVIGNKILHNLKYTDNAIKVLGFEPINAKQGYCRCMTLVLNDNTVITADKGIETSLNAAGINTVLINSVGIVLDGYDKGFIGGAAFKYENTVYFTGDIDKHPDAQIIKSSIFAAGMNYICLTSERLFDIGGAVII